MEQKSVLVGVQLSSANLKHLKNVLNKSMSNTLNLILDKYRNDGKIPALSVDLEQKEKHRCLRISPENKAFLELKKVASISYTINCILTNEQKND